MRNSFPRRGICLASAGSAVALLFTATGAAGEERVEECARIESADERLACYDAAFGVEAEAVQRSAEELADESAAAATAAIVVAPNDELDEDDFGFAKEKSETEGESLTSTITGLSKDAYKRMIFELENGQVWRQIEYKRVSVDVGEVAVIRHGSFNSYKLYIGNTKRWTRVRRVE